MGGWLGWGVWGLRKGTGGGVGGGVWGLGFTKGEAGGPGVARDWGAGGWRVGLWNGVRVEERGARGRGSRGLGTGVGPAGFLQPPAPYHMPSRTLPNPQPLLPPTQTPAGRNKRAYDRPTLMSFAKHHATGEPLPGAAYERLIAAKNFRSATGLLRQVGAGRGGGGGVGGGPCRLRVATGGGETTLGRRRWGTRRRRQAAMGSRPDSAPLSCTLKLPGERRRAPARPSIRLRFPDPPPLGRL